MAKLEIGAAKLERDTWKLIGSRWAAKLEKGAAKWERDGWLSWKEMGD